MNLKKKLWELRRKYEAKKALFDNISYIEVDIGRPRVVNVRDDKRLSAVFEALLLDALKYVHERLGAIKFGLQMIERDLDSLKGDLDTRDIRWWSLEYKGVLGFLEEVETKIDTLHVERTGTELKYCLLPEFKLFAKANASTWLKDYAVPIKMVYDYKSNSLVVYYAVRIKLDEKDFYGELFKRYLGEHQ